jgi:carbon-monoxide dehydrogenase iron sulfur subunit
MMRIYFDIKKCLACRSCELACAVQHSENKDILKILKEETKPVPRRKIGLYSTEQGQVCLTSACSHCESPLCVEACITGALEKTAEGYVICDEDRCIGCSMCIMVCPFGVIRSGVSTENRRVLKCDMCTGEGELACVEACPTGALSALEKIVEKNRNKR